MRFYFFSLDEPAYVQPGFKARLAARTRAAGVAMSGTNQVVVNLGSRRAGVHYEPWKVAEICRHEMNHLFMYAVLGADREDNWHWFGEAMAHSIEDTVNTDSARLTLGSMRSYLQGYALADTSWRTLIGDRDNNDLEQYRDYRRLLVSIVFFLQEKCGDDVVARLMRAVEQGSDIEDAFVSVCGKGSRVLEKEWKTFYQMR